jgi:hypothetical protein
MLAPLSLQKSGTLADNEFDDYGESICCDIHGESFQEEDVWSGKSAGDTLSSRLGRRQAVESQILNAALYKPEVTSTSFDLSHFTPEKVKEFYDEGGEQLSLYLNISLLKTLYPEPIRDITNFPRDDQKIFSPAVRHLPRRDVEGLRSCQLVFHLPGYATAEPIVIETEEERAARKERRNYSTPFASV